MSGYESLPVVLVSAADITAAAALIAEIIDNDATELYDNIQNGSDCVWRIVNKYYTADVRVHALTDQQQLQLDSHNIEAHVIYLTNLECSAGGSAAAALAEARQAGAGAAGRAAHVRLLAADCAEPAPELGAWAARRRRELVPLRETPAPAPFSEECGVQRLRGALQAHTWRGLVRTDRSHQPQGARSSASSESSAGSGGVEEAEGASEGEEESAEAFAAALAEARQERAAAGAAEAREGRESAAARRERVERAERVVAAFCRALGLDPHVC